jgi:AAA+ ATPase superfamily predicted ATPase
MLFDLRAKERRDELYGRKEEADELIRLINSGSWVAVLGPRMIGKTSLMKVALSELSNKYTGVYANLFGTKGLGSMLVALVNALNSTRGTIDKFKSFLAGIEEFHIGPDGISLRSSSKPVTTMFDLFSALGRTGDHFVIALDEVQELAAVSPHLLKILGNVFNTYRNIQFVFSGSNFGLIRVLLEPGPESPLYGRSPTKLALKPFTKDVSVAFLKSGLHECGMEFGGKRIDAVVERLDGLVGWLTLFGHNLAVKRLAYEVALRETVEEGKMIVRSELDHFLEGRDKRLYLAVLRAIVIKEPLGAKWGEVKREVEVELKQVLNPASLLNVTEGLRRAGMVTEEDGTYRIVDPLLREVVSSTPL